MKNLVICKLVAGYSEVSKNFANFSLDVVIKFIFLEKNVYQDNWFVSVCFSIRLEQQSEFDIFFQNALRESIM